MKSNYYHYLLVLGAVAIFFTNVPLYLYENQGVTQFDAPKAWVLMFCLLSFPLLFIRITVLNAFTSPIMIWCLGYAWVTVLWFFLSSQSDASWLEVRNRFFTIIQILTYATIFWEPGATRLARKLVGGAVLFGVALNIYEWFVPMSFSPIPGRSAGLYIDPNITGEALVFGMILSVTVFDPLYRGPFILLTGIGILTTFSRGGILAWVIAVAGLILLRGISLRDIVLPVCLSIAVGIFTILPQLDQVLTTWERNGVLNANVLERLEWFTDPSGVSDSSSWERKYLAQQAWEKISDDPWLGRGTGSSREATIRPHNQFLSFMLDHGLIGALLLPALILATIGNARGESRGIAVVFGCVLVIHSFFSHTILNQQSTLLSISLMTAMVAMSRYQESYSRVTIEKKGSVIARRLAGA